MNWNNRKSYVRVDRCIKRTTGGRFEVILGVSGVNLHVGTYDTLEEARKCRDAARALARQNLGMASRKTVTVP